MKFSDIKLKTGDKITLISFTYDEELELAQSVMESLSKYWLSIRMRQVAEKLYQDASSGFGSEYVVVQEYLDLLSFKTEKLNELGRGLDAPYMPTLTPNDSCVRAPSKTIAGITTKEWRSSWYGRERRRAWREVWLVYKKLLSSFSDDYRIFPGDSTEKLEALEVANLELFFEEVKKSRKEYKVSLDQAIREVRGRLPHGELSIDQLHEIYPNY